MKWTKVNDMKSKKELKRIISEGMKHKARVHVGRFGVRPRVLWVYRHAWDGIPTDPTPTDVVRVKIHPGCPQDDADIIQALTQGHPSECAGRSGDNLIFYKTE